MATLWSDVLCCKHQLDCRTLELSSSEEKHPREVLEPQEKQKSRRAEEQKSRRAEEQKSRRAEEQVLYRPNILMSITLRIDSWLRSREGLSLHGAIGSEQERKINSEWYGDRGMDL
jgi:hypothetical protein